MLKDKDGKYQWNTLKEEEIVDSFNFCPVGQKYQDEWPTSALHIEILPACGWSLNVEYTSENYYFW